MNRIIIVSGVGKLHFIEIALALKSRKNNEVYLITSWVPSKFVLKLLSKIGLRSLAGRLAIRRDVSDKLDGVFGFFLPEFTYVILKRIFDAEAALAISFAIYRFLAHSRLKSLKTVNSSYIIRSGLAGRVLQDSCFNNDNIFVDHSIAHPDVFERYLGSVRMYIGNSLNASNSLWSQIKKEINISNRLLVNSDFVANSIVEMGISRKQVDVVYLPIGIDVDVRIHDRGQLDHVSGDKLLVFTGHFDARKGAELLLQLMMKAQEDNWKLHVFGSISASGQSLLRKYGANNSVKFHGYTSKREIVEFLHTADLFVFPTLLEGCSKSVMEAIALGVPVLTTSNSGVPDEVKSLINIEDSLNVNTWFSRVSEILQEDINVKEKRCLEAQKVISSINENSYSETLNRLIEKK